MCPGCLANSVKRSTKWLPEHVVFMVGCFVQIQVLVQVQDWFEFWKIVKVSNVCSNVCSRVYVMLYRSSNVFHGLTVVNIVGKGKPNGGLRIICIMT